MTPSHSDCRLKIKAPHGRESRLIAFAVVGVLLALVILLQKGFAGDLAYAQAVDSSFEYAENGTSMVGWFRAYDQDGDLIEWTLSGPDADLFTIDGGVLRFKEPPNYEDPKSAAAGNVYRATVGASGGTHEVAVTVTDVDEAGTVSVDRPQPQVSRPFAAVLSDEDAGVTGERWQWAKSEDGAFWTDIKGATVPRRPPTLDDVGRYLRATVRYSDKFGSGKTASAVSAQRVEARTLSNAAPSFADQDEVQGTTYIDISRSVAENTAVGMDVGRAVSASDADNDALFYELLDTPDLEDEDGTARFTIDSLSGRIRVGKRLGADAGEREDEDSTSLTGVPALPPGENAGDADNSEYVLRVKVWDPSTASATVNVIIRVIDVNEAPRFDADTTQDGIQHPPTKLSVTEGDPDKSLQVGTPLADLPGNTYAVVDEDAVDAVPQTGAYSLGGADRDSFSINNTGALTVADAHTPDYEEQSSYSITIVGRSGVGSRRLTTTLDVTINVVDAEDVGEVSLSQREPRVGRVVHATVSDPDGGVRVTGWEWERSEEITVDGEGIPSAACREAPGTPAVSESGWTLIDGVSTTDYTSTLADVGRCLRATATYTDDIENPPGQDDDEAMGVSEAPVQINSPTNTAPEFVDQDLSATGEQTHRTSRRVAENTEAGISIGAPLTAHDDDGDLLMYSLGGADAAHFAISRNDGQLKTKAPLNYEARTSYTVDVIVTDPSGATDSISGDH